MSCGLVSNQKFFLQHTAEVCIILSVGVKKVTLTCLTSKLMQNKIKVRHKKQTYRAYHFTGQEVGIPLAAWLNGPPHHDSKNWWTQFLRGPGRGLLFDGNDKQDAKARTRIIEVIGALQKIRHIHHFILRFPADEAPTGLLKEFQSEEEKVNRILRRYLSYPIISTNTPYWDGKDRHFIHPGSGAFVWGRHYVRGLPQEHWAVSSAIEKLARQGALDRLRRCDICERFFFAKRPDALYCGDKCRARRYDSPRFMNWRARYDQERKLRLAGVPHEKMNLKSDTAACMKRPRARAFGGSAGMMPRAAGTGRRLEAKA